MTRYGALLIGLGAVAACTGWGTGGVPRVLALWSGCAFAVVGVAYLAHRARVFGKRPDGRLALVPVLALWPFVMLTWLTWHLVRQSRREPAWNVLPGGITIGRRLLAHEVPDGITAIVDLTAEFAEPR